MAYGMSKQNSQIRIDDSIMLCFYSLKRVWRFHEIFLFHFPGK